MKSNLWTKKADKAIVIGIWLISILISLGTISDGDINPSIVVFTTSILATITWKIKLIPFIKGLLLPTLPTVAVLILSYLQGGNPRVFLIFMMTIAFASLYNNKRILLGFLLIQIIVLIIAFSIDPQTVLIPELAELSEFISAIIMLIGLVIILYFSVKWGSEQITIAKQKKAEAKEVSQQLQNLADEAKDVVDNLSAYSEELSASAEESNATIETTSKSIESMSAGIEEISASAQEVASFSDEATEQASAGRANINSTVSSIKEINQEVNTAVDVINNLDQTSEEIEEIVELITSITEQTNLLALNASIEAARAGEHGQGFAVVADEIRQLAKETSEATDKIADLVVKTQQQSKKGIKRIKSLEEKANQGKEIVEETGEVFEEIEESIQNTSKQISQIAHGTNDLAEKSNAINSTSKDIKYMSEDLSTSSQELASMAQKLANLIAKLKL